MALPHAIVGLNLGGLNSGAAYNPALEATLLEGWDASLVSVARPSPGTLSSWTGVKGTVATLTGSGRVYSLTSMVDDEGGTHPGITLSSTVVTMPIGSSLLNGRAKLGVVLGWIRGTSGLGVLLETAFTGAGRFSVSINNGASDNGDWQVAVVGAVGNAGVALMNTDLPVVPSDPCVLSFLIDMSISAGSSNRRVDGYDVPATVSPSAVSGANLGSTNLFLGSRSNGTVPVSGQVQQLWLTDGSDVAALERIARYVGTGIGAAVA